MWQWIRKRFRNEPVVMMGLARALVLVFAAFGLPITEDQLVTIIIALEPVFSWLTRREVEPTNPTH